jgi:hypothetical protein
MFFLDVRLLSFHDRRVENFIVYLGKLLFHFVHDILLHLRKSPLNRREIVQAVLELLKLIFTIEKFSLTDMSSTFGFSFSKRESVFSLGSFLAGSSGNGSALATFSGSRAGPCVRGGDFSGTGRARMLVGSTCCDCKGVWAL